MCICMANILHIKENYFVKNKYFDFNIDLFSLLAM